MGPGAVGPGGRGAARRRRRPTRSRARSCARPCAARCARTTRCRPARSRARAASGARPRACRAARASAASCGARRPARTCCARCARSRRCRRASTPAGRWRCCRSACARARARTTCTPATATPSCATARRAWRATWSRWPRSACAGTAPRSPPTGWTRATRRQMDRFASALPPAAACRGCTCPPRPTGCGACRRSSRAARRAPARSGRGGAAAWDAAPGRRLWLGALLDAAAAGGDDWHGPWPGDLVDVLAVADEVSLQAIYGDTYSAPGAWLAPVAGGFKTMPRPAYRRECAQILARMAGTCPGMWPLLHDALTHALLGTWPVPARRPSLANRRAALRFVSRAAGGPRAWLERHPPLVLVAAFYARYVAERARGATWAAQSAAARHFWARFEGVLEHARAAMGDLAQLGDAPVAAAAAAPDAPGAARVRAFATAVARWAAAPRGNVAAAREPRGADMCVAPGAPPSAAEALVCPRGARVVHNEVGGRGPWPAPP